MRRRQFIAFLIGITLWPRHARAQGQPVPLEPTPTNQPADQSGGSVSIGQVSTVQGSATVSRAGALRAALKVADPIYRGDVLATGPGAALGVTFDDNTTFSLSADARITVDDFVYQPGGSGNSAAYTIAIGTVAFVASEVAKTGDMTIATPTTTLGIRGTTGVVDVPANAASSGGAKIKLYADADGRVGHIDVFDRQGARLGDLTQNASAFEIQRRAGGRFAAVPFHIPPQEAARDRGVVRRLFASHAIGRRMTIERRQLRQRNLRRNPGLRQQPNRQGGQPRRGLRRLNPFKPKREKFDQR
jgi:FecR protein